MDEARPGARGSLGVARWISIVAHPFVIALALVGILESPRGWMQAARSVAAVGLLFVLPLVLLTAVQVRRGALLALLARFHAMRPGSPLVRGAAGVGAPL